MLPLGVTEGVDVHVGADQALLLEPVAHLGEGEVFEIGVPVEFDTLDALDLPGATDRLLDGHRLTVARRAETVSRLPQTPETRSNPALSHLAPPHS